jgi:hypothetical protein
MRKLKVRINCVTCRNRIEKEIREEYLKQGYDFFTDSAYSIAYLIIATALCVFHKRGRSKAYIRSFYDEMLWILKNKEVFGKEIIMTDIMKMLTEEYGIDFNRVELNLETEKEFIHGCNKALKGAKK